MNAAAKKPLSLFLSIGLIQGLLYKLLLSEIMPHQFDPFTVPALLFVTFAGSIFLVSYNAKKKLRLSIGSFLLSLAIAVLAYYEPPEITMIGVLIQVLAIYAATLLLQTYHQSDYKTPNYSHLFANVWNNACILIASFLFLLLTKLVLNLWGGLFSLVGVPDFDQIFSSITFYIIFIPFFFATGLYLGFKSQHLIYGLRNIILAFFKAVLPVLAFIGILFLLTVIVKAYIHFSLLINTAHQIGTLNLGFVALAIIFINSVYQDGHTKEPLSRWYRWIMNTFIISLPLMSILSLLALFIYSPQEQHLNSDNIALLLLILLCLAYTLFYTVGITQQRKMWLSTLKTGNTTLAWALIGIAILLAIPGFYQLFPKHSQPQQTQHYHRL